MGTIAPPPPDHYPSPSPGHYPPPPSEHYPTPAEGYPPPPYGTPYQLSPPYAPSYQPHSMYGMQNGMNPMMLMLLSQNNDDSNDLSPLLLMQMLGEGGMGMKSLGGMHPMMLLHLKNSGRISSSEMLRLMMMGGMKPPAKNPMQSYLYDKLTACKEPIEECTPPNNYNMVNCGSEEGETDDDGDDILPCCLCTSY